MVLQRPQPGSWTYEDLLALPDDGTRYEIIVGDLYEMTGPDAAHSLAVISLLRRLFPFTDALEMTLLTAPSEIFFAGASPVQPDLVAFLPGDHWRGTSRGFEGVPAFVVEVLSPSTRGKDLLTKRDLYERSGIDEYWIVDPAERTVRVLVLENGVYRDLVRAEGDAPVRSRLFPDLDFPASAVFEA